MPSPPLGITASQDHFSASGGTVTTSGAYTVHTFTASGTFTIGAKGKRLIEWEIIGGGGAGGNAVAAAKNTTAQVAGGGGGGGYVESSGVLSPFWNGSSIVTAIPVTVGAGGATNAIGGNPSFFQRDGSDGTVAPLLSPEDTKATGARGGGSGTNANVAGYGPYESWYSSIDYGWSGSGGGGGRQAIDNGTYSAGGAGKTPNGNSGAGGSSAVSGQSGGGGGGASSSGISGDVSNIPAILPDGGNGKNGVAGGGGGGVSSIVASTGGLGKNGGGNGSTGPNYNSVSGSANTGGGGGGGGYDNIGGSATDGASGGSGKIVIKYLSV